MAGRFYSKHAGAHDRGLPLGRQNVHPWKEFWSSRAMDLTPLPPPGHNRTGYNGWWGNASSATDIDWPGAVYPGPGPLLPASRSNAGHVGRSSRRRPARRRAWSSRGSDRILGTRRPHAGVADAHAGAGSVEASGRIVGAGAATGPAGRPAPVLCELMPDEPAPNVSAPIPAFPVWAFPVWAFPVWAVSIPGGLLWPVELLPDTAPDIAVVPGFIAAVPPVAPVVLSAATATATDAAASADTRAKAGILFNMCNPFFVPSHRDTKTPTHIRGDEFDRCIVDLTLILRRFCAVPAFRRVRIAKRTASGQIPVARNPAFTSPSSWASCRRRGRVVVVVGTSPWAKSPTAGRRLTQARIRHARRDQHVHRHRAGIQQRFRAGARSRPRRHHIIDQQHRPTFDPPQP